MYDEIETCRVVLCILAMLEDASGEATCALGHEGSARKQTACVQGLPLAGRPPIGWLPAGMTLMGNPPIVAAPSRRRAVTIARG
ncbi:hypothetical protein B296_00014985 [Ensete ventricosum]|uniref:Uncharacterized protein n=1 Tax=Ensete ventricosum TaxID=4639 RepID=A0A427ALP2_ENSVE|nr:hypothetical protein B296_00014985 [Ensete ventricosum]